MDTYVDIYFEKWIFDSDKPLNTDRESEVEAASQTNLSQGEQHGNKVSVPRLFSDAAMEGFIPMTRSSLIRNGKTTTISHI